MIFKKMERFPQVCLSFFPQNQVRLEAMTVSRQAGYSPWAWASLFDATATAERMEAHWFWDLPETRDSTFFAGRSGIDI